jgi:hypothetical protein
MAKSALSDQVIRQVVSYDPETGRLFKLGRVYRNNFIEYGEPLEITGKNPLGYIQLSVQGRVYLGHRMGWYLHHGEWPQVIDHINGDRADNRIQNLRNCRQSDNVQNLRGAKSNSNTGLLGVSFDKERGKFVAGIGLGGKRKAIGRFDTAEDAHEAYLAVKRQVHSHSTV